ncbi:MAG: hypothetical protein ACXAC5_21565 [Promethearchaeota archaeon]|jgi:tetratricopeptide (TPR) repeat protein
MSDPRPEELIHAEKLLTNGKVGEVLEIISNFEKKRDITPKEQLWSCLLRGEAYTLNLQFKEAVKIGNRAYRLSKKLEMVFESIQALNIRAQMLFLGKPEKALDLILQAEESLNSLIEDKNKSWISIFIIQTKSFIFNFKGEFERALEVALKGLELAQKTDYKILEAYLLFLITLNHVYGDGELNKALNNAIDHLKLMEEIDFQVGIASGLWVVGEVYYYKGDLKKALEFCEKSLTIREISNTTKANALAVIGASYMVKGELDLALDSYMQAVQLSEEISLYSILLFSLVGIGFIYIMKNDYDRATQYLNRSLMLSLKAGMLLQSCYSNFGLFFINIEMGFNEEALNYLENLRELTEQTPEQISFYLLAKALILKKKRRSRDRAEAEKILKQIVNDENFLIEVYSIVMVSLCDLLLEELYESDDLEIIDELTPLIQRLLERAENQNSFSYFAEGKLLKAKLALIQFNLNKAKSLLTQAQHVAEEHGLDLLAQKISVEHDNLLEREDEWAKLKDDDATMAERIELASFDGVFNRLQRKRAIEPPELVNEEPILLLIMDNSGTTYFNHPFITNWDHSDLFSSFMSAFNTFMDEIFSKSIDRIRVGENTILINPVEPFLACYVIKGQSYPALQKLIRFTEAIRENSEIWQALKRSVKTSEMLELDKPPALKTLISEIFIT